MIHCEKYITAPFKWIDMCPSFLTRAKPFEGGYSFIGLTAFAGLDAFAVLDAFAGLLSGIFRCGAWWFTVVIAITQLQR